MQGGVPGGEGSVTGYPREVESIDSHNEPALGGIAGALPQAKHSVM